MAHIIDFQEFQRHMEVEKLISQWPIHKLEEIVCSLTFATPAYNHTTSSNNK